MSDPTTETTTSAKASAAIAAEEKSKLTDRVSFLTASLRESDATNERLKGRIAALEGAVVNKSFRRFMANISLLAWFALSVVGFVLPIYLVLHGAEGKALLFFIPATISGLFLYTETSR